MKNKSAYKLLFIQLCVFVLASCGNGVKQTKRNMGGEFAAPKLMSAKKSVPAFTEEASVFMNDMDSASGNIKSVSQTMPEAGVYDKNYENGIEKKIERKIVRNGSVSLEVESLDNAEKQIGDWASKFGGYIINSWESETSSNYTVKIPSEKFEEAFNESKSYGRFLNGSIYSDDITDQYYDLETRLSAKKILRERLEGYLASAKETKELLNIERELNSAVSEIESMEGRLRRMKDQVSYSVINISLQLPYRTSSEGFEFPSWSNGLRRFGGNVLDFFIVFLKIISYLIVCGIPVVAMIAFLFWLLFGKVGLLVKLFKKLRK